MGLFDTLPYANFHDLNLNWIIKKIKELETEANNLKERVTELENRLNEDS